MEDIITIITPVTGIRDADMDAEDVTAIIGIIGTEMVAVAVAPIGGDIKEI